MISRRQIIIGTVFLVFLAGAAWVSAGPSKKEFQKMRQDMVRFQIAGRDVSNVLVLKAMETVARHLFVPEAYQHQAYGDHPLPIGHEQTISQPYIVAKMTELAEVKPGFHVLEIGTGSGYQAAVLAELKAEVYSIEIIEDLTKFAEKNLKKAGYEGVHLRTGDGYKGWPEKAPFDVVIVTAAPEKVPQPLLDQLKEGGKLVIPVGKSGYFHHQELRVYTRKGKDTPFRTVFAVSFVPMTGEAQKK